MTAIDPILNLSIPLERVEIERAKLATMHPPGHPARPLWPVLADEALQGLAGQFVGCVVPHSEADPVALLGHFLCGFGSLVGRGPHFRVGGTKHFTNLNVIHVGATASRKGTAKEDAFFVLRLVDDEWSRCRVKSGLSSGEGLVWAVRDAIEEQQPLKDKGRVVGYQTVEVDPGITDKRLLIVESEFGSTLRVMERDGNTLSATIRQAWDSGDLQILTKNKAALASGAHTSVLGHVTKQELLKYLSRTEQANGFGNRFLWLLVRRSKYLPDGGALTEEAVSGIVEKLKHSAELARGVGEVRRSEAASRIWHAVDEELSGEREGMFGAVTSRAEAQTMRLALIYALLDSSRQIEAEHLHAALALWQYAEESARLVFGDAVGDETADAILRALETRPGGMTRTDINGLFGRNKASSDIGRALGALVQLGRAHATHEGSYEGGRPSQRWLAVSTKETKETKKLPCGEAAGGVISFNSFNSYQGKGC